MQPEQDKQWAAVSCATELAARWRAERRAERSRERNPVRRLRLRLAVWLVRSGLRMADPLTVEHLLKPS